MSRDEIRNRVAGAALWLWLERGEKVKHMLMSAQGAQICYIQGVSYLGDASMSPVQFSQWCMRRRGTADAALSLWLSPRIVPQAWFRHAESRQIRHMAARADSRVLCGHPGYIEPAPTPLLGSAIRLDDQVIGYVGGDNPVADAAQWLWLNRRCGDYQNLTAWDSATILRIEKACQKWDDRPDAPEEKNYSLSDLRRAYDMGFAASGEGWNQEIHPDYLDNETYQAERLEALREFSKCK